MTTQSAADDRPDITPVHGDPIRIVPLNVPDELLRPAEAAAPAVAPQLTYRGGPLFTNVRVSRSSGAKNGTTRHCRTPPASSTPSSTTSSQAR